MSRILGVSALLVAGVLIFNYFKSGNDVAESQTSSAETEASVEENDVPSGSGLPADYIVRQGDTLWDISQKAYGSGYKWVDVFSANRGVVKNPNLLLVGAKITLPKIEAKVIDHVVAAGESLWKISANYCGSGFGWVSIARDNSLANPRLIQPGQKLMVVCR